MTQSEKPSIRDVNRQRQQAVFVGREEHLAQIRLQLTLPYNDPQRRFILNIFGQGGVGKSTLLHEASDAARTAKAVTALTDDNETDVPAAMAKLVRQLVEQGYDGKAFLDRYKTYRAKRDELEAAEDAPVGLASLFAKTTVKAGAKIARNTVPGSDLILDFVEEPLADQASQWAEFVRKKLTNKDERELVLEPETQLTPLFVNLLNDVVANGPVLLMFDTYEATCGHLDDWLHGLLDDKYGRLPTELTLIISGRDELDHNAWVDFEGIMAHLPLEPLTEAEAREFLARKSISNEKVIEVILSLSGNLPLLLATLAAESPNDPDTVGDVSETAVERFLKWVDDPARRALAVNGALPRRINRDILALLGGDADGIVFEWLCHNPFVERRSANDGWTYHEVVRAQMLRYKRAESPADWKAMHEQLAEHAQSHADNLGLELNDGIKSANWRMETLNALYHRLCANPDTELIAAVNQFVQTMAVSGTFVSDWAASMKEAGEDCRHDALQEWGVQLLKGLKALSEKDYQLVGQLFSKLIEWTHLQSDSLPAALTWRGQTYRFMKRYAEALTDFDRAIEIDPNNAWIIAKRGVTYGILARFEEALADLDRATEIDPDDAWAIASRGVTYRLMKRYDEALVDLNRAVEIDPDDAWTIASRGVTYSAMMHHGEALVDFDRAVEIDPEYAWVIARRGVTYQLMKRYEEALADFDRAIEIDSEYAWAIAGRAETYRLMKRYEEALTDFDRAIAIEPDTAWTIAHRGDTYRLMKRYEEALADFDRAIEIDPEYAWAIASRRGTYRLMRRFKEALADLDEAIEIDPEDD